MGRTKAVAKTTDFLPTEVMKSRSEIEERLRGAKKRSEKLKRDFDRLRLRRETWIVRKNAAHKALSKNPSNENLKTLLQQAEYNIELVMEAIEKVAPMITKSEEQAKAAEEGIKAFQRLDIMLKTSNQASRHQQDMQSIVDSIAQVAIDADIDFKGIKNAEYILQARTELSMNKEITM